MKKFFTLVLLLFAFVMNGNAKLDLDLTSFSPWTGDQGVHGTWNSGTKTFTVTQNWGGGALWRDLNLLPYDKLVIKTTSTSAEFAVTLTFNDGSNNVELSPVTIPANASSQTISIPFTDNKARFKAITIKLNSNLSGTSETIVIDEIYFTSDAEESTPGKTDLGLTGADLGSAKWGVGVSYNASTNTVSFGTETWQGIGWSCGNSDFSAYQKVVVEFAEPIATTLRLVVEYNEMDGSNHKNTYSDVEVNATCVVVDFSAVSYRNNVTQIYMQNKDNASSPTYKIKRAYVATDTYFVFDEAVEPQIAAKTGSKVELYRSITANKWSTIVLPFDLPSSQFETVFGSGASVAEFTGGNESTLNFTTTLTDSKMKANQPYAIKVASDFSSKTISNVTIVSAATPTQNATKWDFVGNYTQNATVSTGSYYFKNNALHKATSSGHSKINGFRGYFTYTGGSTPAPSLNIVLDGTITGIKNVTSNEESRNDKFFNLSGQQVSQPTKGIYIKNGKKYIIK